MNDEQEDAPTSRAALVADGVVENVILVTLNENDSTDFDAEGFELVLLSDDSPVGIGWTREDGEFVAPSIEE